MADEDFDADETVEEAPEPAPAAGGGGGPMKMIIIGAAVLVLGGGGAWFFLSGGEEQAAVEETAEEAVEENIDVGKVEKITPGIYVSLEDQTINVMKGKRPGYLVFNATFDAEDQVTADELTSRTRQLSDLLLREIARYQYEQLINVAFRDTLEALLRAKVNARLTGEGKVRRIYFDQWIVQ